MPTQFDPAKTVLIISSLIPKSLKVSTGNPIAMASRAAVEDTVTRPRAPASASAIDPAAKCTASGDSRPAWTSAAYSWGYGHGSAWVCRSMLRARSLTTAEPVWARASRISSRSSRRTGTLAWAANTRFPSGAATAGRTGGRNGSVASPKVCGTASSAASVVNSATSR